MKKRFTCSQSSTARRRHKVRLKVKDEPKVRVRQGKNIRKRRAIIFQPGRGAASEGKKHKKAEKYLRFQEGGGNPHLGVASPRSKRIKTGANHLRERGGSRFGRTLSKRVKESVTYSVPTSALSLAAEFGRGLKAK